MGIRGQVDAVRRPRDQVPAGATPLVTPTAGAIASDRMGKYAGQSLSAIQESQ